jgi:hypothetical protein
MVEPPIGGHPSMEFAEELAAIVNADDLKQRLSKGWLP